MDVMRYTEEEWLEERSRMLRKYHKAVRKQKMTWQKINGLMVLGIVIASWSVWNWGGRVLVCLPVGLFGAWLVYTDRLLE